MLSSILQQNGHKPLSRPSLDGRHKNIGRRNFGGDKTLFSENTAHTLALSADVSLCRRESDWEQGSARGGRHPYGPVPQFGQELFSACSMSFIRVESLFRCEPLLAASHNRQLGDMGISFRGNVLKPGITPALTQCAPPFRCWSCIRTRAGPTRPGRVRRRSLG